MNKILLFLVSIFLVTSCSDTVERLKRVGKAPEFQNIDIPTVEEDEEDIERRQNILEARQVHMRKTNSRRELRFYHFF